jgi:hypothetical protein
LVKTSLLCQDQTKNPFEVVEIHNLPQNLFMGSFGKSQNLPYTIVVQMWNPMACSFSYALGSSLLDEWESQIIHEPPSLNA